MDVRQLQVFLAVATYQSLSAAADALGISQPALSKQIKRIEANLGVALLERLPRGVVLTPEGRTALAHFELIQREFAGLVAELKVARGGAQRLLAVGAGATWLSDLLPRATVKMLSERPDTTIRIIEGSRESLIAALHKGEIEIALIALARPGEEFDDLVSEGLIFDELRIVVRANHALACRSPAGLAGLADARWVLPRSDFARARLRSVFAARGLPIPVPVVESDSIACLLQIVRHSDFVTFVSRRRLAAEGGRGLAMLDLDEATWWRTSGVLMRRGSAPSSAAVTLLDTLRKLVREQEDPLPAHAITPELSPSPAATMVTRKGDVPALRAATTAGSSGPGEGEEDGTAIRPGSPARVHRGANGLRAGVSNQAGTRRPPQRARRRG